MNQQNKAISTKPAGYCVLGKFEKNSAIDDKYFEKKLFY